MDRMGCVDPSWEFQSPVAELRTGRLTGRVDVAQPGLGLHDVAFDGRSLDVSLLCVRNDLAAPWPLSDAYVRGSDLVATYRPRDDWPFSPQVYWQANLSQLASEVLGGLSLSVSVQTHLLDTWPRIIVESHTAAEETFCFVADASAEKRAIMLGHGAHKFRPSSGPLCVLRRLAPHGISFAEIVPASDFRELSVQLEVGGKCSTRWELFADFLEKGVIWRARMQCVLLPRENDVELAKACCRAFEERPLPLTT